MRRARQWLILAALLLPHAACAPEPRTVRVATYNLGEFRPDRNGGGVRAVHLRAVLDELGADVIALQEVPDRAALEAILDPAQWLLVIDDDAPRELNLAVAVKKPLRVLGVPGLDADDDNFLFPGLADDPFWPNRRDALHVEVGLPGGSSFDLVTVHLKSRYDGRDRTQYRRAAAAAQLVTVLRRKLIKGDLIVLGDFNDNPDDQALNILESGKLDAPAKAEDEPDDFLDNLTEPLCAAGYVSWGRTASNSDGSRIDTLDPNSRDRNNDQRGEDGHSGDILFDQLLVSPTLAARHVRGSTKVFDGAVAVEGDKDTAASDHLPVYADFGFD